MTRYGDLASRIRLGEDSVLELKQVFLSGSRVTAPDRKDVADELAAFANGRGGDLVLGVDDETRDVSGIPLDRLDAVDRMLRFDETAVPGTGPSDLDYALTRRFLREEAAGDAGVSESAARKLRLVADDDDGSARITLAGVLLCTRTPQRWLPHAYVQAVSYAGERTDVDYQTDARDIAGPLDERDYSVAGARIRLYLFGNRLELSSRTGLTASASAISPSAWASRTRTPATN